MQKRDKVITLLGADAPRERVLVKGWVRTRRDAKGLSFLELNDGSCLGSIQVIAEAGLGNYAEVKDLGTGAAIAVEGRLVASPGSGQRWEVQADSITVIGTCPEDYPLQKKRHSDEFLRTIAHLRPRTNKYGALFRMRSRLAHAIHQFFQDRGFYYIHTPILTASDCEGAGGMFAVTTLDLTNLPKRDGRVDFSEDFFGKEAKLTVSGQLSGEMFALGLGEIYTFGPTFVPKIPIPPATWPNFGWSSRRWRSMISTRTWTSARSSSAIWSPTRWIAAARICGSSRVSWTRP